MSNKFKLIHIQINLIYFFGYSYKFIPKSAANLNSLQYKFEEGQLNLSFHY